MEDWSRAAVATAIAAVGGLVAFLQKFASDSSAERRTSRWSWRAFWIKTITGGFVGLLTYWLLSKRGFDENVVHFLVAVAGYGGVETIEFFKTVFHETLRRALIGGKAVPPKDD